MIRSLLLFICVIVSNAMHFNGGTIRWMPVNPYDNSSSVTITIIQTYWWSYPRVMCATNVPISTTVYRTDNVSLICVTDCTSDGGYSTQPVSIVTDCISASSSLGMMTSQRSVNITLTADAHFYLAYVGSAWRALNYPTVGGLQWSIVSFIDLRLRPDGSINTPPTASVVSPQYVFVNQTANIPISVSDANVGDDVRCRWSKYTPGYRRRKRSEEEVYIRNGYDPQIHKQISKDSEIIHTRKKRNGCAGGNKCISTCLLGCLCSCAVCLNTTCTGSECTTVGGCPVATTTVGTTTIETPGTLMPTSSYPNQQPIDECGGICYPSSLPNGTTLSNCTLTFEGLVPNTWYAVAIQVNTIVNSIRFIFEVTKLSHCLSYFYFQKQ